MDSQSQFKFDQPSTQGSPRPAGSGFVPPTPEELAQKFPQIEILGLIGKGGMGAVHKAKQVTVKYEGSSLTLTFDKDGIKGSSGAPTSGAPGAPVAANQGPGAIPTSPTSVPQANPTANAASAQIRAGILRRTLRLPNAPGATAEPTSTVAPPPSPAAWGAPAMKAQDLTDKTATKLTPQEEEILRALQNGQAPQ